MQRNLAKRGEATPSAPDGGAAGEGPPALPIETMVTAWQGPAVYFDATLRVRAFSRAAADLLPQLDGEQGEAFRLEIERCRAALLGGICRIGLSGPEGRQTIEWRLLPAPCEDGGAPGVLALGRDVTGERNLVNALVASRQLFKDLMACSSDFGWETDADGLFTYVSPKGGFGYSAKELVGMKARMLLDADRQPPGDVFTPQENYRNWRLWLKTKDGGAACVIMSGVPRADTKGRWAGARGMCQDMTELQRRMDRERLLSGIVGSIRTVADPAEMLRIAAREIADAFEPADCAVVQKRADGFQVSAFHGFADETPTEALAAMAFDLDQAFSGACEGVFALFDGRHSVIAAPARYQGRTNGGVIVRRRTADRRWSEADCALLEGVADHLGIALEQMRARDTLESLSRTDELTGLLNRRAFGVEVEKRIAHQRRTGRGAALLYFDLDNFKTVNDRLGHSTGDEVLQRLGALLAGSIRPTDLAARIGGDEFLLWLEEVDSEGAAAKARSLLVGAESLCDVRFEDGKRLGLSIGVAMSDPAGADDLDELIGRADAAMYRVKRRGKAGFELA